MLEIVSSFRFVSLALCLLFPLTASASESDVNQMLEALEKQLALSQEKYEALKPELKSELEQKSRELSRSLDSALDQGLTELEKLGEEYEAASRASSEKFRQLLESDQVTELKGYLSGLDKEAINEARDQLVTEFAEMLELTATQLEVLKPLLKEKLEHLGAILKRYLEQGKHDYEQFRVEFEAERQAGAEQFRAILDAQQFEKYETQLESIREAIRTEVFEI